MRSTRGGYLLSANLEQIMGFLTTEQLAAHLAVSARQIQRLAAAGMPSVPVGARGRRYDRDYAAAVMATGSLASRHRCTRCATARRVACIAPV